MKAVTRRDLLISVGFSGVYLIFSSMNMSCGGDGGGREQNYIFALRGDGRVAVIDTFLDEVIRVIETGGSGGTLGSISKDGRFLYVGNNSPGNRTVSIIDAINLTLVTNLETGSRPKHPVVSPDGELVAVNHSGLDGNFTRVVFISTSNNRITSIVNIPVSNTGHTGDFTMHGAWSPDGQVYAVGNYADNKFYLIGRNGAILAEISVAGNPHYFDWKGRELWVTVEFSEPKTGSSAPYIYVYDCSNYTNPIQRSLLVPSPTPSEQQDLNRIEGHHGNLTEDGKLFIFCNRGASPFEGTTIAIYDATTKTEVTKLSSSLKGVGHAYLTPDGRYAVITQYGDSKFEVLDLFQRRLVKVVDAGVGRHMGHAVFSGRKMYITNRLADSVFVVDTDRWEITKRIQTATSGQAQGQVVKDFYQVFERVGRAFILS